MRLLHLFCVSALGYVTAFLGPQIFLSPRSPLVSQKSHLRPSDQYLQALEGKRKSRYSRSWQDTVKPRQRPRPEVKQSHEMPEIHRPPPVSETGIFRLEKTNMNFTDIGGYEDVKEELVQTLDFLHYPDNYTIYNVRLPKGILLTGPPGTGKTLFAKCLAGEANLPFIATAGSIFSDKYVGVGAGRVRELFQFARENAPCIVFIDELDSVARSRSDNGESAQAERDQTLNQLLVELDGFRATDRVVILAATNRDDIIDEALKRSGRFDKTINIGLPDENTREQIIKIHGKGKPLNVSEHLLVDITDGMTGADIECLLNEVVLRAIRRHSLPVNESQIETVFDEIVVGRTSKPLAMSDTMLWRVAVHEIGHTLMSFGTKHHGPVRKVTIKSPNGHTPGYTIFDSTEEAVLASKEFFEDRLCVLLGGRVAEEIIFGEQGCSAGASQDLNSVRQIAESMVIYYGFGDKLVYSRLSQRSRQDMDRAIEFIIEDAYKRTTKFLETNGNTLIDLAELLMEKKTLSYHDLVTFLRG